MTGPDPQIAKLRALVEKGDKRITWLQLDGEKYWAKRPETLKPRMRMQKGSPRAAFERERRALRALNEVGAPVARLVIDDPDLLVTAHCGVNLLYLAKRHEGPDRMQIFHVAGQALARLHAFGHAHGRPALKDLCWEAGQITIIDFERAHESLNTRRGRARDVVLLVINTLAVMRGHCPEVDALIAGYRAECQPEHWAAVLRWSRNLTWLTLITRPLHWLPLPIREVRTLPVARDYFRRVRREGVADQI